jgi:NTP pyrophosphatase (non-canonical NTP hydrolase)
LTLFDSPLDLGQIQSFHERLDAEKGFDGDPVRNVAYLVEEIGEVARAVRRLHRSKPAEADRTQLLEDLAEELADCLAYLAKIATSHGIDLEQAYVGKMERNSVREWPLRSDG